MYSTIHLLVAITLSAFVTAATCETMHWLKDRKQGRQVTE